MIRTLKLTTLISLGLACLVSSALAQGEAGAPSLSIPPGARANAMGKCYVALADDATAMWWNPAGLGFVRHAALDLMHTQLVSDLASDVFFEYLGGVYRIQGIGVVGAAVQYLTYGQWLATGEFGEEKGVASSWEISPMLGGAVRIMDQLAIGMNLKFVYISLAPAWATLEGIAGTGHSAALDFGALWKVPDFAVYGYNVSRLNLGLAATNLGPAITFINRDQAAPLPRNLRLGLAYAPVWGEAAKVTLACEVNRPLVVFESSNTYHAGAEFLYANLIAVRAGYMHDRDGNIIDPTYGLGFVIDRRLRIDWSSIPQSRDLARVHRWSIGVTF